jgi:hypothetical protein
MKVTCLTSEHRLLEKGGFIPKKIDDPLIAMFPP